jgi:hypothetical protein
MQGVESRGIRGRGGIIRGVLSGPRAVLAEGCVEGAGAWGFRGGRAMVTRRECRVVGRGLEDQGLGV